MWRRLAAIVPLALLAALPLLGGCAISVEERDVFRPIRNAVLPDGIERRNVEVALPEGGALRGWFLKSGENRPVILYFYGNADRLTQHPQLFLHELSARHSVNVLCLDYRGYGASDGTPTLQTMREDALRVWDQTQDLRGAAPTYVMGFSLGTLPAIHLAASRPAAGLVLLAALDDAEAVIPTWRRFLPWYVRPFARLEPSPALRDLRPKPVEEIRDVRGPLLELHGSADEIVPVASGRRVFEACGSAAKTWCELPGLGHNQLADLHVPAVSEALRTFLGR